MDTSKALGHVERAIRHLESLREAIINFPDEVEYDKGYLKYVLLQVGQAQELLDITVSDRFPNTGVLSELIRSGLLPDMLRK